MKSMTVTEFKAKCLRLLDHIPPEELAITKRGKTVAIVYPEASDIRHLYGAIPDLVVDKDDDLFSTGELRRGPSVDPCRRRMPSCRRGA